MKKVKLKQFLECLSLHQKTVVLEMIENIKKEKPKIKETNVVVCSSIYTMLENKIIATNEIEVEDLNILANYCYQKEKEIPIRFSFIRSDVLNYIKGNTKYKPITYKCKAQIPEIYKWIKDE